MRFFQTMITIAIISFGTMAQKNVIDQVIAVVGDEAILKSDIEQQYQQALMEGISYSGDFKCHLLEQELIQKLMLNQAVLDSVEVSENTVVNQVDARINQFINQIGSKEKLEEYFNKSVIEIKREQMKMMRNQMMTQQMQSTITANIAVTPSDIRLFMREMPEDSLPMIQTQYEIQQIAIYPPIEKEEIENVKEKLRGFQKQVAEGRDFATLAVLYSEDPGSAAMGGDLGWMTRGQLVPEFANVAFNMREPNKVSKVVETEYGFHVIQMVERKGERINVRHILMKPKVSIEARQKALERLDSISKYINDETITFERAAMTSSQDKDTRTNGGILVNPYNQSTKFDISHIPAEMNKELQSLKEGELSKPFLMKDNNGKDVYKIIKLKRKLVPHRASLKEDLNLIQDLMINRKRKEAIDNWIKQKQNETYITIIKDWQNCEFNYKNWIKE